ncbi:Hsp20/alpha crystallin family protein [Patescibacteria group bacterium]|nr:Hsp20/alpha crystallin family protein [Patescibacteria group bacterium]
MSDFLEKLKKGMDTPATTEEIGVVEADFTAMAIKPEPMDPPKKTKKKVAKKPASVKDSVEASFFDGPEGELTVDVFQSGKDLIIRSAIGGIESEDLDIVIENDFVVIKGVRPSSAEALAGKEENVEYFFQECHWGSFKREISLPLEVDSSRAKAKLEKGILIIRMPIIERNSKTKVSIE